MNIQSASAFDVTPETKELLEIVQGDEEEIEEIEGTMKESESKGLTAIIIGAGKRADVYSEYARKNPDLLKVVAVADPNQYRRERLALLHLIPFDKLYISWICVPDERIADIAIISTMENMRFEIVHAFAERGYAIILEKPMAQTYMDCVRIVKVCSENNIVWAVAHSLRYDPHVFKILDIIEKGILGEMISIHHTNPIGWYHFAHSHVRGKWAQVNNSSSLFINKCCHDMDFIRALQPSVEVRNIFSVGSLMHFKEENKPPASGDLCIGCAAEEVCPYSASRIYLKRVKDGYRDWPITDVVDFPDNDTVTDALLRGPYGKCVYEQNNDSIDNQVAVLVFDSGVTATMTCNAFTEKVNIRQTVIRGSRGELTCNFDESFVKVFDFVRGDFVVFHLNDRMEMSGSSFVSSRDADRTFIESFLAAVKGNVGVGPGLLTTGNDVLKTYLYLFSVEKSRIQNKTVNPSTDETQLE